MTCPWVAGPCPWKRPRHSKHTLKKGSVCCCSHQSGKLSQSSGLPPLLLAGQPAGAVSLSGSVSLSTLPVCLPLHPAVGHLSSLPARILSHFLLPAPRSGNCWRRKLAWALQTPAVRPLLASNLPPGQKLPMAGTFLVPSLCRHRRRQGRSVSASALVASASRRSQLVPASLPVLFLLPFAPVVCHLSSLCQSTVPCSLSGRWMPFLAAQGAGPARC